MIQILLLILITITALFLFIYKNRNNFTNEENILPKIFKIYVIALPKRIENMKNFFKKLNITNYEFIEPVMKDTLDRKKLINDGVITSNYLFTKNKGRIACHLSHLKAIKTFLDSDYEDCIIFEDDLKLIDMSITEFNNKVQKAWDNVPENYDILYWGRCYDKCNNITVSSNIHKTQKALCRHAYSLSRKGADIILNNTLPLKQNIFAGDQYYKYLMKNKILKGYSVSPSIFYQNREDLGTNLGNNDNLIECI